PPREPGPCGPLGVLEAQERPIGTARDLVGERPAERAGPDDQHALTSLPDRASALGQRPDVLDHRLDLLVREMEPEAGHPRLADRRAAVLDELEQVLVGVSTHPRRVGEIARPDQEERRAPRAAAV